MEKFPLFAVVKVVLGEHAGQSCVQQWYRVVLKMAGPGAEESQPNINRVLFVSVWETQKPVIKCYKHLKFPIHDGLTSKRHSD